MHLKQGFATRNYFNSNICGDALWLVLKSLRLCFLFCIASGFLLFTLQRPQAAELDPVVSRAVAHEMLQRLAAGDRKRAIARALEIIPGRPDEHFMETHQDLWSALWRAITAKMVFVDTEQRVLSSVSPDGSRMIVVRGEFPAREASMDFSQSVPVMLFDTASGEMVMDPIPAEVADKPNTLRAFAPSFSPDSKYVAVDLTPSQSVLILDAKTGERIREINVGSPGTSAALGFSPDSRLFAVDTPGELLVFDVLTGSRAFNWRMEPTAVQMTGTRYSHKSQRSMGWTPDNRVLVGETVDWVASRIFAVDQSGSHPFLEDANLQVQLAMSHPESNVVVLAGLEKTLVVGADGNTLCELPGRNFIDIPRFTRNGKALSFPRLLGGLGIPALTVDVTDLAGNTLEPIPEDFGPFGNYVIAADGSITGFAAASSPVTYAGDDVPADAGLYDVAIEEIGAPPVAYNEAVQPQDTILLKSKEFARAAREKLRSGDSRNAAVMAMKGLPADPEEEDFERFGEAALMLFRASAARTLQVDAKGWGTYVVGPDGRNAVVVVLGAGNFSVYAAHFTFGNDSRIVEILHPSVSSEAFERGSYFSPGGDLLLMSPRPGDRLSVFDGRNGTFIRDLFIPDPKISDIVPMNTATAGFSPDGALVAAQNGNRVFLFDPRSGEVWQQYDLSRQAGDGWVGIAGWGKDGELYFTRTLDKKVDKILVLKNGGISDFTVPETDADSPVALGADLRVSSVTSNMILTDQQTGMLYRHDGKRVRVVHSLMPGLIVRKGTAAAFFDWSAGVGKELKVFDFEGNALVPVPEDYVLPDSVLYDLSGQAMGWGLGGHARDWSGQDLPNGRGLYLKIWNALDAGTRQEIDAERIAAR
ncbi:NHL repeat-containing protein [Roseibium marinum]|uniref:WD40 repeat domain-containing protein n=1 Tax=Roseibium marinum TaxID=281252 RepID=A0A2S3UMJ9_9HYPH|nr:hypothetical protein [Roseibium marinum]POF28925.1 hypothetical protein CLV41_111177 [Roseibium marinum]